MSFLTASALAIALLVAAPILAHMLRRRQAEERPFPPRASSRPRRRPRAAAACSRTAPSSPCAPLAVLGLAILGATPFIHCSRAGPPPPLGRVRGPGHRPRRLAQHARAALRGAGRATRWARALASARELTAGPRRRRRGRHRARRRPRPGGAGLDHQHGRRDAGARRPRALGPGDRSRRRGPARQGAPPRARPARQAGGACSAISPTDRRRRPRPWAATDTARSPSGCPCPSSWPAARTAP